MRDSYKNFFEYFNINFSDVIKYGIDIEAIYPDTKQIEQEWNNLKDAVTNNGEVFIRGHGRDAHGTSLYQELYKVILKNKNIKKDSNNNSKPTQLLQKITKYSKDIKEDNNLKKKIANYQVAHIFGKARNPFLFTAPWNIIWKPKILDPFTGHESTGEYKSIYKKKFEEKYRNLYAKYIDEYNDLSLKYFNTNEIEKAFKKMELEIELDKNKFKKFKTTVYKELSQI